MAPGRLYGQCYPVSRYQCMEDRVKILESEAYLALKNAWAAKLMHVFLRKGRRHNRIVFTYREAREAYGVTDQGFSRAIDALICNGLIDIVETQSGLRKNRTVYAISNRWQQYGTPSFEEKLRPRRKNWLNLEGVE